MTTTRAPGSGEPVGQDAAFQVAPELFLHVIRHAVAHGIGLVGQGQVGLQVFPDDTVQRGGLGAAPTIGPGMGAAWRRPRRGCGPPRLSRSGSGLCGHQRRLTPEWSEAVRLAANEVFRLGRRNGSRGTSILRRRSSSAGSASAANCLCSLPSGDLCGPESQNG